MRRAVLRGRSGDIVTAIQLADRTGIVAASAPPADSASPAPSDIRRLVLVKGDVAPEASTRRLELIHLVSEAGLRRHTAGRARRRALFTGAAVMCLALGWIGGGTFGYRHVEQTTPTVAVGVATGQARPSVRDQLSSPAPVPVTTTAVPNPPAVTASPPVKPPNKRAVGTPRRTSVPHASRPPSVRAIPRTPLLDNLPPADRDTLRVAIDGFQRFMKAWPSR